MLSTQDIAQLIQSPRKLGGSEIDQLRQLADRFPYSQVFAILYLQSLSLAQDVLLENEIQRLAIRIQDRTVLYNLIHTQQGRIPVMETAINVATDAGEPKESELPIHSIDELTDIISEQFQATNEAESSTESAENKMDALEIATIEETETNEVEEQSTLEPSVVVVQSAQIIDEPTANQLTEETIENTESAALPEQEATNDKTETLSENVTKIVSAIEKKEEQETKDVQPSDLEKEELERKLQLERAYALQEQQNAERQRLISQLAIKLRVEPTVEPHITLEQPTEKVEETEEIPPIPSPTVEVSTPKSFTSWLKAASTTNGVDRVGKPVEQTVEKSETTLEFIPSTVYSLEKEEEKIKQFSGEEGNKKKNVDALIDKFIKEDPKITSPKKIVEKPAPERTEMYNPMKKGKESLNDAQLPVSETLAKIFVVQGNFPKAIFAYQQLMLIFPEKKTFFAKQIKELEKKLNTK